MAMYVASTPPLECQDPNALRERIDLLIELALFEQAIAEIQAFPRWTADAQSLWSLARVLRGRAPHMSARGNIYDLARALYRAAVAQTRDPFLRADLLAETGAAYFEEGRLRDAAELLEQSRALAPWPPAYLGLIAIACARRDRAQIRARCRELVEELPGWHMNPQTVAALAADPDFAFLRASAPLFYACFGGSLDHLRALDERYRIAALERAVSGRVARPARGPTCTSQIAA